MKHKWNIEMNGVSLVYPNGKEALKNINLKINEGEMVAIIGLSGAGKTTLLKTINKLSDITSGEIIVGEREPKVIEEYKNLKRKFHSEKQKYEDFKQNPNLTNEIISSFEKELLKNQTRLRDELDSLEQKLSFENQENAKLSSAIKKALEEDDADLIVKLHTIEQKRKIAKIRKIQKAVDNKKAEFNNEVTTGNALIVKLKDWENNKKEIQEKIVAHMKKRVEHFKSVYFEAKKDRPYYEVHNLKGKAAMRYKTRIGMVFQRYSLIYKASVLTNVLAGRLGQMPWWRSMIGFWSSEDKARAFNALADVNILEVAYARAEDLSGGQMQRVALARTITQEARIILADEPVGALDPIMAKSVMDSFLAINQKMNKTVLMNLHHVDLALTYADRIIGVKDGKIIFDGKSVDVDIKTLKKIYGSGLEVFDDFELAEIMRKRKLLKGSEDESK